MLGNEFYTKHEDDNIKITIKPSKEAVTVSFRVDPPGFMYDVITQNSFLLRPSS